MAETGGTRGMTRWSGKSDSCGRQLWQGSKRPHLLVFMCLCNSLSIGRAGPSELLLVNEMWQKRWMSLLWAGYQGLWHPSCRHSLLAFSFARSDEASCRACLTERLPWQGTEGGLWPAALEELRPLSGSLWGSESCRPSRGLGNRSSLDEPEDERALSYTMPDCLTHRNCEIMNARGFKPVYFGEMCYAATENSCQGKWYKQAQCVRGIHVSAGPQSTELVWCLRRAQACLAICRLRRH